ncbi:hypothetical protein [uncultured Dokdonia sp.]|uniref:hypothetical protein n=1 Tax=uncultured Dokdonia sp. TaxID=575653 RepID=UPI0026330AA8|nr:hypothetical protein [uncultured Dokdonia sp.]
MIRTILIVLALTCLTSCKSVVNNLKQEPLRIDNSKNLYAFIGRKISVTEFDPNNPIRIKLKIDSITKDTIQYQSYVMDSGFRCKYLIEKNVFNKIETDTIEFKAYDHYGRPGFEKYDQVLLYLSKDENGNYYHQKYQFESLFLNSKGQYYSYPKFLGNSYLPIANELETFEIEFPKSEKYNSNNVGVRGGYYEIDGQFAYPVKGMFLEEIIEFRLRTTFKHL